MRIFLIPTLVTGRSLRPGAKVAQELQQEFPCNVILKIGNGDFFPLRFFEIVHLLHRRPPLSQNSHPLCDLDIDFEHIDSLLAKDAKDFALSIFRHDIFDLFLCKPGRFSDPRDLYFGGSRGNVRIQAGTGGRQQIGGDILRFTPGFFSRNASMSASTRSVSAGLVAA